MKDTERLTMTLQEFAKAIGISRGLCYDLARQDRLPVKVIKLGRRRVLSRKAVEALLSGNSGAGLGEHQDADTKRG